MTEKQYSIIWTGFGTWLLLFCLDSVWVSTKQESIAPGIGALDGDPYSAALWGTIVGSGGLLFMCLLAFRYANNYMESNGERFLSPAIFGLESDDSRLHMINRWGNFLFIYLPIILLIWLFKKTFDTKIYENSANSLFIGGWLDTRIQALKSECEGFTKFCFRIGGPDSDQYFPIVTDLVPITLFSIALMYLYKWRMCGKHLG